LYLGSLDINTTYEPIFQNTRFITQHVMSFSPAKIFEIITDYLMVSLNNSKGVSAAFLSATCYFYV